MAGEGKSGESIGPAFWVLFIVGLVIVLSLFRGFAAAVENSSIETKERKKKMKTAAGDHRD